MHHTRKLSLVIAFLLILQLGLPSWLITASQQVSAATSGPIGLSFSPAANMTNVPLATKLQISFDENVKKGASTAYISIYETESNRLVESISAASGQVSVNQRVVTITRSTSAAHALALDTNYHVLIDSGAFLNVSNNAAYSGIQDATVWSFRTAAVEDNTRPAHTSLYPTAGTTNPITTQLVINFDKPVFAAAGNIELRSTDDTRLIPVTSSSVTGSGTTQIVIMPEGALLPSANYTVTIPSSAFKDGFGNIYNGTSWSFSTDAAPVNLAASNPFLPVDDSTLVPLATSLTLTLNKAVQARPNKYVEIRQVSNNQSFLRIEATSNLITVNQNTITINPSKNFAANTAYYVLIDAGAFTEPDPNGSQWFHGISSATIWNFSTGYDNDKSPPQVTEYTPARNGSTSSMNTQLKLKFNEPVFPDSGNIEIRHSSGGTLFRSIPITSARVTGGGTNTLTIDPNKYVSFDDVAKAFVNNTRYYVTISNRAIRDAAGNHFGGISGTSGWTFTVTQDTTRPVLNSLSPATNATAVGLQARFTATFNKPVVAGTGNIQFFQVGSSTTTPISARFWVDPADSKRMIIEPSTALRENTKYYINIDETAITDQVGNRFIGILNEYQWTFQTIGGDKSPPTITRAEGSGSTIRLIYNEPLKTNLKPTPASYYVTVGGVARTITSVSIAGNTVTLTLSSSFSSSQQVKVSYTKPAEGLVQDLSGNQAASFSDREVSNGFTSKTPVIVGGSAYGSSVVLNFNEQLASVNSYAYTQFTVNVAGTNYYATSISSSGSSVTLTINGSVSSGQTVRVTYTPGSYPLNGLSGLAVSSFNSYNITSGSGSGSIDYQAPILQAITASGTMVLLKYNKALNTSNTPGIYQYSIVVGGNARTVKSVQIVGDSVYLTLDTIIQSSESVKVTYISTSNTVTDIYGNAASSFSNLTANENLNTGQIGSMQSAILKGAVLTLTFNEVLNPAYIPNSSMFVVRVNDYVRVVSNVIVSGNNVTLTLSSPGSVGERVTVTYYTNTSNDGLRTISGQAVNSFSNVTVANQTTLLDALTGDYEAAENDSVGLKTSAATTSSDISPAGVAATRYTIMNDRFITAVTTSRNAGISNPRVVFKVPSHEKAALVGISVISLEMANKNGGNVTLAVQHGDATYELPLNGLNFTELSRMVGGNGVSNHVVIQIDQGSSNMTSALTTALNSSSAQIIGAPVNYEVAVVNGSNRQALNNINGYVTRTLKTSASVNPSQTAVVWFDPITGTLSYVPTQLETVGGITTATFKRKGNSAYALVRNTSSFTDITNHWSASDVQMMARKFIVEGHTVTKFEPQKAITRGEFATYIAKGLGLTGDRDAAAKFKDVNTSTVMGAYIGAAAAAGIVNGTSNTAFKPNDPITRQDMAAMMMRAAKVAELTVTLPQSADSYLHQYTDRDQVSSYAKTDVAQSIYLGIINGKSSTRLSPLTNATRAEGTVMIMRLLEKAEFLTK